jgi:ABC-type nitrate/sulfonate/bicarbonate transport system permease component
MNEPFLEAVLWSFLSYLSNYEFWQHAGISFTRVVVGVTLGIGYAIVLIFIGRISKPVWTGIAGINSAIRYAPPTAFIGIIIVLFGLGGQAAVALICLGTAPYILLMFLDTLDQRPSAYDDFVKLYRVGPFSALFRILMPYALPGWIRAVRVNIGAAWTFLIVAEMIGAQSGIGYLMALSQRFLRIADMVALIIIVGLIGLATDASLALIQRSASPWQGKYYG